MAAPVEDRLRRIASRQNALLKEVRRALAQAELTPAGDCAIEGSKTVEEAIRSGLKFRAIIFSDSGAARLASRLLAQLRANVEAVVVDDEIFRGVVSTENPQGVVALAKPPEFTVEELLEGDGSILLACGIQDPGNLGTMLRSAEAFSAAGVVLCEGTVSRLNQKVIRASAGSIFRLPQFTASAKEAVSSLRKARIKVFGTSSHEGTPLPLADLKGKVAIAIGNEGAGLPPPVSSLLDGLISIPHSAKVESLNAGIAASLILYEAARQRAPQK